MSKSIFFPNGFPESLRWLESQLPEDVNVWNWLTLFEKSLQADRVPEEFYYSISELEDLGINVESNDVWISKKCKFPKRATSITILGPCFVARDCQIRHGAFLRDIVIAGEASVLGNSCEFKNCLLLSNVAIPHFSYVGDSILGNSTHLGAGAIISNLRLDQEQVKVTLPANILVNGCGTDSVMVDTGLKKFGAIMGDASEVGCNAVLNPGSILGPNSLIGPTMSHKGYLPSNSFSKQRIETVIVDRL